MKKSLFASILMVLIGGLLASSVTRWKTGISKVCGSAAGWTICGHCSFGHDAFPNNGAHNQLFFTAGPDSYANGLFGVITVGP